jgi:hypothetical protein
MITINGTSLQALGFIPAEREIPRLGGERTALVALPGAEAIRMGGIIEPGVLAVHGSVVAADHTALLAAFDTIAAACRGLCVIRFSDITDREWLGYLQQGPTRAGGPRAWISSVSRATLQWALPDRRARAQALTEQVGANPALVFGTAAMPLTITIANGSGTISQVGIDVRTSGGIVRRSFTWNGSLSAGASLVVDAELFRVTAAGVNAINGASQASEFPIADPAEGAHNVLVSVMGGSPTITTRYRRRWL